MNTNFSENLTVEDFNSIHKIANVIGKGNPGAIKVLVSLFKIEKINYIYTGKDVIEAFDHLKIYGYKVWVFYKDVCNCSFELMENILLAAAWEIVSEEELHRHIDQAVGFIELPSIEEMEKSFEV